MLNIIPVHKGHYNCWTSCVATVSTYFNKDWYMNFGGGFYLMFEGDECYQLGYTIRSYYEDVQSPMLDFHGIGFEHRYNIDFYEFISTVKEQIDNVKSPIILISDIFKLPWNKLYLSAHMKHDILIIGYGQDELYVLDPYFSKDVQSLKFDFFLSNLDIVIPNNYYIPDFLDSKMKKYLLEVLNQYCKQDFISFNDKFRSVLTNTYVESHNSILTVHSISTIRQLRALKNNRISFCEMLNVLQYKYKYDFNSIISEIDNISMEWGKLTNVILKFILNNKLNEKVDVLCSTFQNIVENEIDIANKLINILGK